MCALCQRVLPVDIALALLWSRKVTLKWRAPLPPLKLRSSTAHSLHVTPVLLKTVDEVLFCVSRTACVHKLVLTYHIKLVQVEWQIIALCLPSNSTLFHLFVQCFFIAKKSKAIRTAVLYSLRMFFLVSLFNKRFLSELKTRMENIWVTMQKVTMSMPRMALLDT